MVLSCCLALECLVPHEEMQFVAMELLLSEVYRFIAILKAEVHTIALTSIEGAEGTLHFLRHVSISQDWTKRERQHFSDTQAPFVHSIV